MPKVGAPRNKVGVDNLGQPTAMVAPAPDRGKDMGYPAPADCQRRAIIPAWNIAPNLAFTRSMTEAMD
jgi:hypothetical protein